VPVVDLCGWGSADSREEATALNRSTGKGRLVALAAETGRTLWERRLPSPDFGCATVSNDVVFTSTLDGTVYAFAARNGSLLWHARMGADVNACPTVVGDVLIVGSGIRRPGGPLPELVAFGLRDAN
jgi:alcohol dehydrogenase (cytochrome c)